MEDDIKALEKEFSKIGNGFKEFEQRAKSDFKLYGEEKAAILAKIAYQSRFYQVRMYAVFLFGYLSIHSEFLKLMKEKVSKDENWRVQEILAKSFDEYCKTIGYEQALGTIDDWLQADCPNVRRAVTEGLRIWTNRPYFKQRPQEAIQRLAALKSDPSEYVRKSVGNALKDISKKHPDLVRAELKTWAIATKEEKQVYQLAKKFINI